MFFQEFSFGTVAGSSGLTLNTSGSGKMPNIIREFLSTLDDEEWKSELFKLLQNQSFNQVEVDLFELLCKVLDQNLFAQVDWARNSCYFKELEVGLFSHFALRASPRTSCLRSWRCRRTQIVMTTTFPMKRRLFKT